MKTYRELNREERVKTFESYQKFCEENVGVIPFDSFEDYDCEQEFLDMGFDEVTLECLG